MSDLSPIDAGDVVPKMHAAIARLGAIVTDEASNPFDGIKAFELLGRLERITREALDEIRRTSPDLLDDVLAERARAKRT